MIPVYLGLGSNIERERYLLAGLDAMQRLFGALRLSSVYDSPAIGFDGQPFLNMVIGVETDLSVADLIQALRAIEYAHGRSPHASRFSSRQLDIDLLTYGDACGVVDGVVLPREEILENAFVLRPLAELAPEAVHPGVGRRYADLWAAYDQHSQPLARVDFDWRGRRISRASAG
jgi:2-amino-4-hydroxy-6-hydroxymethyldihydropteridine diphosphokinase